MLIVMLHKTHRLVATARCVGEYSYGAPWDATRYGDFVEIGLNWALLESIDWL